MNECLAFVYSCVSCGAWGLWRSEGDIECPRTGVRLLVKHHVGAGNQTPVISENKCCKTAKPPFQSLSYLVCVCVYLNLCFT